MSNPSKAIGTRAETKVARHLSAHGLPTERKALAGSADKGDLRMTLPSGEEVTVEVKAGEQTRSCPRYKIERWKEQTLEEGRNSGCRPVLVVVKYRRQFKDTEVWIPNELWMSGYKFMSAWTMMYLDDFEEEMVMNSCHVNRLTSS